MEPTIFFKKLNIEESLAKIKKNAEEIIDQLVCSKETTNSDLLIGKAEIRELKKYLTDPNDEINRRVLKFINLLKISKRSLYQKDVANKLLTLKCYYCPFIFESELKKKEKDSYSTWVVLANHLI